MSKNKTVNPFTLFAIFLGGTIIALPLRVYQMMSLVEPSTGFWSSKNFTVYVLYAVMALVTLCSIVVSRGFGKGLGKSSDKSRRTIVGIISFIAAATLLYNAVIRYANFSDIYFAYDGLAEKFREYLTKSGAIAMALEAFFAVVSAIYFLLYGISCVTAKSAVEYKLLALAPVLWCIFRMIHRFMRTISYMNVSELFLELCMIVMLMMFFMMFAQVTSRVNGKGMEWKLYGYGLPAAMFCLLCFVPRLMLIALGKSDSLTASSPLEPCDAAMAAFVLSVLISRAKLLKAPKAAAIKDEDE